MINEKYLMEQSKKFAERIDEFVDNMDAATGRRVIDRLGHTSKRYYFQGYKAGLKKGMEMERKRLLGR